MIQDLTKVLVFDKLEFQIAIITDKTVYQAVDFKVKEKSKNRITAATEKFVYADGRSAGSGCCCQITIIKNGFDFDWQAQARHFELIKSIQVYVSPLPLGKIIAPDTGLVGGSERSLTNGELISYIYPFNSGGNTPTNGLNAQFIVIEGSKDSYSVSTKQYPPRILRYTFYRQDNFLKMVFTTEANAWERKKTLATEPCCVKKVKNWKEAVDSHAAWLEETFNIVSFIKRRDVPDWAKKIGLVVNLHGQGYLGETHHTFSEMSERLQELSRLFPPERTLVYIPGWCGPYDLTYPDYEPDPDNVMGGEKGFRQMIAAAHKLGYKIMPHVNHQMVSITRKNKPLIEKIVKEHSTRNSAGDLQYWRCDYDSDGTNEIVLAIVSPDSRQWREYFIKKMNILVEEYGVDALHLDTSSGFFNDPHHNYYKGACLLFSELKKRHPNILIGGEGISELMIPFTPFVHNLPVNGDKKYHPVADYLYQRYLRTYAHLITPSPDGTTGVWPIKPIISMKKPVKKIKDVKKTVQYNKKMFNQTIIPTIVLADRSVDLGMKSIRKIIDLAKKS